MSNLNPASKLSDNLIDYETVCTESIEATRKTLKPRPCLVLIMTLLGIIFLASLTLNFIFLSQPSRCQTADPSDQMCFDCRYFHGNGPSLLLINGTGLAKENDDNSCCVESSAFYQVSQTE